MTSTKKALKREFEVSDMSDLHWLLGIQIEYSSDGILLSQTAYIDKILLRFGMQDCNPLTLPLDPNTILRQSTDDKTNTDISRYQQIIESLMYATIGTRPDLAFTVTHLSQFNSNPSATHYGAAKHKPWHINRPFETSPQQHNPPRYCSHSRGPGTRSVPCAREACTPRARSARKKLLAPQVKA